MDDKFEPYRQKAKDACKDEIKKYVALNKALFLSRLGKKEMDLLRSDLIVDDGEIRSLPEFFQSCLY